MHLRAFRQLTNTSCVVAGLGALLYITPMFAYRIAACAALGYLVALLERTKYVFRLGLADVRMFADVFADVRMYPSSVTAALLLARVFALYSPVFACVRLP